MYASRAVLCLRVRHCLSVYLRVWVYLCLLYVGLTYLWLYACSTCITLHHDPGYQQESQFPNQNHYRPAPMGHQYRYPIPYDQYSYPQQPQQYQSQRPTPSQQATNICQLCHSQGHYDYQCQFAGDFIARTQKAFNQGRSYSHQDPNHGDWSQGENDNNDPNGQPFQ